MKKILYLHAKMANKFEKTLKFIREAVQKSSPFYGKIYLVGGCVRDELLGERYTDLDLLINMPDGQHQFVEWMCREFSDVCKGPFYYQRYGTTAMDVIIDHSLVLVECVEPHVEEYAEDGQTLLSTRYCTLEEDSSRRDYTCNALYKNLHSGEIIDPTGRGASDIRAGLLITPSEPGAIYRQDPVRMLRGIRFKHQKGFQIDQNCWNAIIENAHTMEVAAPKRLRDELNKMLKSATFGEGVQDLLDTGLAEFVMPGFREALAESNADSVKGRVEDYLLPEVTIWQHTKEALRVLCTEHRHVDTLYKLAVLMMDVHRLYGRERVVTLLQDMGIGKDRTVSIAHVCDVYWRFFGFYDHGQYIEKQRVLPRFITGLMQHKNDFRRMVRALNTMMRPDTQLPWRVFYDNRIDKEPRSNPQREANAQEPTATRRNHRRNVKRREQRKRARNNHSNITESKILLTQTTQE